MEKEDNLLYRAVTRTRKFITSPEFLLGLVAGGAYIALTSAQRSEKKMNAYWDEMENRTKAVYGDDSFPVMDRNRELYAFKPAQPEE